MTAVARVAVLDLRTVWPYRYYCLAVFDLGVLVFVMSAAVARTAGRRHVRHGRSIPSTRTTP